MSSALRGPAPLEILFVIDPIETLLPGHDSSVALMEAAQTRGHHVSIATTRDLEVEDAHATARARTARLVPAVRSGSGWTTARDWFDLSAPQTRRLSDFHAVFMRVDPPVDADYLRATYLLDRVDRSRTVLVNRPSGLRNANEKLFALRVPELGPATLVSADPVRLSERVAEWGTAVLKPTDAMAGRGIFVLSQSDVNLRSLLETATERGARHVVLQRWIPESELGDRRVIVLDGEPIGAVRRVSVGTDFRCNMAAGAEPVADAVTERDREICAALAPHLRAEGLVLVGIDVIGGQLTEVNVTSPTGLREIDALSATDLGGRIVEWVEHAHSSRLTGAR
jgi:glutathione synthase